MVTCVATYQHFSVFETNDARALLNLRGVILLSCVRDHRLLRADGAVRVCQWPETAKNRQCKEHISITRVNIVCSINRCW